MPILTRQKSEQSQSITITRPPPTVWQHLKNCIKKCWLSFPTVSESLSLFFHPSLPPCRKHRVCDIHWTMPAFSCRPHRLGSRPKDQAAAGTAEGSATTRAEQESPWAPNSRELFHTIWMKSEQRTGMQGLVPPGITMHLYEVDLINNCSSNYSLFRNFANWVWISLLKWKINMSRMHEK